MHQQDHLLSCQLCFTFPPVWTECVQWSRKAPNEYHLLIVANELGQNRDSLLPGFSQPMRGFPAIESMTFQHHQEHDVTFHIKGECMHMLEALFGTFGTCHLAPGAWSLYWRLRAL